ncbi:MAG: Bax inhibitor-1/YccA family protein [bacterium]
MYNNFDNNYSGTNSITKVMYKVYAWMGAALAITAATAYGVYSHTPLFTALVTNKLLYLGLILTQFALVLALSFFLKKMSFGSAALAYIVYAITSGATLSVIFALYQLPSIVTILCVTMAMFFVMALYGYYTKADLTSMGNIMLIALFGFIIASVVNMFLHNSMLELFCAWLGVIIFTGLIAYDTQKIKDISANMIEQGEPTNKIALFGALTLYLDVVNLFLSLLRLFGKKKD